MHQYTGSFVFWFRSLLCFCKNKFLFFGIWLKILRGTKFLESQLSNFRNLYDSTRQSTYKGYCTKFYQILDRNTCLKQHNQKVNGNEWKADVLIRK